MPLHQTNYYSYGSSPVRVDGIEKVTGAAIYSADVHPAGMLYGKILTSPIAHGYIKSIDTSAAKALPGVVTVITGADVPDERRADGYIHDRHMLCKHKVRYVGDFVAAVAAVDESTAKEALSLIKVEYEELPAILDPFDARREDCPVVVHDELFEYEKVSQHGLHFRLDKRFPNQFLHRKIRNGDVEKGFEESDLIIENTYKFPQASQCYMEPNVALADPHPDGSWDVWACEQQGAFLKADLCAVIGIEPSKMTLHVPYVGGGFGGKTGVNITPIAILLAKATGHAVRLEDSREECFVSGNPRAEAVVVIKDGYQKDGTLMARKITTYVGAGAYSTHVIIFVSGSIYGATGSYKTPNLQIDAYGLYTNKTPCGPYRALGSELYCYAIECNMDRAAKALGMDPVDLRLKNVLEENDVDAIGQRTHNNEGRACIETCAKELNWKHKERPAPDGPWVYGRAIALGNKVVTFGATGTSATVKLLEDGVIELRVSHNEIGQGALTVDEQAVCEEFKIPADRVKVVFGSTATCPYDEGTYCSRGTFLNGNAIIQACGKLKEKLFRLCETRLNIPAAEMDTEGGYVFEKANPSNRIAFPDLFNFGGWIEEGELLGTDTYIAPYGTDDPETGHSTDIVIYYSHGAWGVECWVNRETGDIRLENVVGMYDCGTVVNYEAAASQLIGSLSMGLGQAVYEETVWNKSGKIINASYRDYRIPTFMDAVVEKGTKVDFVNAPHRLGPHGAKGIGEVAMIPVMPAISNAINDALGAELNQLPITPERALRGILKAEGREL